MRTLITSAVLGISLFFVTSSASATHRAVDVNIRWSGDSHRHYQERDRHYGHRYSDRERHYTPWDRYDDRHHHHREHYRPVDRHDHHHHHDHRHHDH